MMKSEYIRNLNCNYERVLLDKEVDHKRYQYCILGRGGIRHLLSCSYKCIDEQKYLYYDISSKQNIRQVFSNKCIRREWMESFFWNMEKMRQELNRFLLDERNIIWSPEHIFQELETGELRFLYIPYYGQEKENEEGFHKLLEFWVERIDYEDEALVEFVYHAYEQYAQAGECYLEKQVFEDFRRAREKTAEPELKAEVKYPEPVTAASVGSEEVRDVDERKSIFSFLDGRKRRTEQKNVYREEMKRMINGYAVCEEPTYDSNMKSETSHEEFGKTIYIEEKEERTHALYTEKGDLVVRIEKFPFVLGKRKEDVDYVLTDYSSSRVHARLIKENENIYLEDLNSTNGTFKNGLRLQPYEKKKLEKEDSLRFGKSVFIYQ